MTGDALIPGSPIGCGDILGTQVHILRTWHRFTRQADLNFHSYQGFPCGPNSKCLIHSFDFIVLRTPYSPGLIIATSENPNDIRLQSPPALQPTYRTYLRGAPKYARMPVSPCQRPRLWFSSSETDEIPPISLWSRQRGPTL